MQNQIDIVSDSDDQLVLNVRIPKGNSFLDCEDLIQEALNDVRKLAAKMSLKDCDPRAETGSAINASDPPRS